MKEELTELNEDIKCPFCGGSEWGLEIDMDSLDMSQDDLLYGNIEDVIDETEELVVKSCEVEALDLTILQARCECGKVFNLNMDHKDKKITLKRDMN